MNEKRFTAIPETVSYKDNLTGERLCPKHEKDYYAVLNKLNKLSEDNEYLKIRFKEERDTAMRLGSQCDTLTIQNQELKDKLCELGVSDVKGIDTGLEDWLND